MAPAPQWPSDPLKVFWSSHHSVVRHGVARGVVEEVRPLVDVSRRRLDDHPPGGCTDFELLAPGAWPLSRGPRNQCDAARHEHTHHFVQGHVARVLGHEQVHQVIGVRQPSAVPAFDCHLAGEAQRLNVGTSLRHVLSIRVEAMHKVAVGGAERGGKLTVAAAEMYDQPPLDAGGL